MRLAYFFLAEFGMPPDITARQDEVLLYDLMKFHRQANYYRWANRHDVDDDGAAGFDFTSQAPNYRKLFGGLN